MDYSGAIEEIGILETNLQIEKYLENEELIQEISMNMPIPSSINTKKIIRNGLKEVVKLKKKNLFVLSNEIAFFEEIFNKKIQFDNIIVVLSRNLTSEQKNNIIKNAHKNINMTFINELEYPTFLKPNNSVLLSFGYVVGNNCIISENVYRMIEIYKDFLGEKIFIGCVDSEFIEKPKGWLMINGDNYFTKIVQGGI